MSLVRIQLAPPQNLKVTDSKQKLNGAIAQLVEQRTENPCVAGSNPAGTTTKSFSIHGKDFLFIIFSLFNTNLIYLCRSLNRRS